MNKKLISGVLAAVMLFSAVPCAFAGDRPMNPLISPNPVISPAPVSFTDLPKEHWAFADAAKMVSLGYMEAAEGAFAPAESFTRGAFVTVLWRMSGKPVVNALIPFADVQEGTDMTEAIRWAAAEQLVNGVSEDTFDAEGTLTREMLSAMIYRYVQKFGMGFQGCWMFLLSFSDAAQISEWADEAMHWMVAGRILKGVTETEIAPQGVVTRAEGAVMLSRLLNAAAEREIDFTRYGSFEAKPEEGKEGTL